MRKKLSRSPSLLPKNAAVFLVMKRVVMRRSRNFSDKYSHCRVLMQQMLQLREIMIQREIIYYIWNIRCICCSDISVPHTSSDTAVNIAVLINFLFEMRTPGPSLNV